MHWTAFRSRLVGRVLLLTLMITTMVWLFEESDYLLTPILLLFVIVLQVGEIIRFVERSNREMNKLLEALKNDSFSNPIYPENDDPAFSSLFTHIEQTYEHFKQHNVHKETQYQYLHTILQYIDIGIITFRKSEEIHLFNNAAKKLLGISRANTLSECDSQTRFVEQVRALRTGQQSIIKSKLKEQVIEISICALELQLNGEVYKLITLQNIHNELSDKEMEAWQNLLRVLTHEMMNSLAPISSLTQTLEEEIETLKEKENISLQDLEDIHLASQTVFRRSKGLSDLVSKFRNLSRLPVPVLNPVLVEELFSHIHALMKNEVHQSGITLEIVPPEENFLITADRMLIEQVLINIIQNAIHALSGLDKEEKRILIYAETDSYERSTIWISDNGKGIDQEVLHKIFVPFYTTKTSGSGIGLSLARQIMQQHRGSIQVFSEESEGTRFALRF